MAIVRLSSLALPILAVAVFAAACGSDGDDGPETSSPSGTRVQTSPPRSAAPGDGVVDLAVEPPLSLILGADSGDYANDLPALDAGDVNGDGLDDLLIGARFGDGQDNARPDSGEAYLIYGRAELASTVDLGAGQADVTIYGARGTGGVSQQGDQLGFSGALGDTNGDGLQDIVLGAPLAGREDTRALAGAAYVILGRASLPAVIDLAAGGADLTLLGGFSSGLFGDAVTAGDMDGDGADEIIIGSPFEPRPPDRDRGGQQAGAVFVFRGGDTIRGLRDTGAGDFDMVIYGKEEFEGGDEAGDNVVTGDLNNDGLADIVITGEAADGPNNERSVAAEVYVVYGSRELGEVVDIGAEEQDVIVYGADNNDTTGFNIAAGDVTGDGIDDMLVSMRGGDGESNRFPEAGELHIFPGPSLPEVIDLANYAEDRYVYGADSADFLGNGATILDWDGDGAKDLAIGSPMGDGLDDGSATAGDMGEVHVIDARSLRGGVSVRATPIMLSVYGARAGDALGQSLTSGDFNGDGAEDLAVLAMRWDGADGSRPDAGGIYILTR